MLKPKLLVHGHWIYDDDTGWKLAVYPIGSIITSANGATVQSVILCEDLSSLMSPSDAIDKIFMSAVDHPNITTLYNLGDIEDQDLAVKFEFYLVCPTANIRDTMTHPIITNDGYMYVEDLGIDKNSDPFDQAIFEALSRLEVPHNLMVHPGE